MIKNRVRKNVITLWVFFSVLVPVWGQGGPLPPPLFYELTPYRFNFFPGGFDPGNFIFLGLTTALTMGLVYRIRLMNLERDEAQRNQVNQLERINVASGKFVPKAFLNFLGKSNILEANLGDYTEKQVTVLFSDIRDYTSLSERMSPEDTFKFVNAFNGRMGPIIQEHDGFVNQYLGDGIMAIFPYDAAGALEAAIAIQIAHLKYNKQRIEKKRPTIRMGIGIHTGPLIMGIIGDSERLDAATISDTVNTAARIESLTKEFGAEILLSEDCLQSIRTTNPGFQPSLGSFRQLGEALVKGKKMPIHIHACILPPTY